MWRMPFHKSYLEYINKTGADLVNTGGRPGSVMMPTLSTDPQCHADIVAIPADPALRPSF